MAEITVRIIAMAMITFLICVIGAGQSKTNFSGFQNPAGKKLSTFQQLGVLVCKGEIFT
jgi:hypothetical protein